MIACGACNADLGADAGDDVCSFCEGLGVVEMHPCTMCDELAQDVDDAGCCSPECRAAMHRELAAEVASDWDRENPIEEWGMLP